MSLEDLELQIRENMLKKYGDRCLGRKDFFLLKTKGLYKNKTVSFLNLIIEDSPVLDVSAESYKECFASLLKIIDDHSESRAETILRLFGHTSSKPLPPEAEDTYFYMIIFNLLYKHAKNNGLPLKDTKILPLVEKLTHDELNSFELSRGQGSENTRNYIREIVRRSINQCDEYPGISDK